MKNLKIKKIKTAREPDLMEVSRVLDGLEEKYSIDTVNWDEYSYAPQVQFALAYNGHELFIKYYVREEYVMAQKTEPNQGVCQDSCVEFFVSPISDGPYYNFEFNPIGTCLLGKGTGRHDSKVQDPRIIERIRRLGSMGTEAFDERIGDQQWTLVVAIPLDILFGPDYSDLSGKIIKGNFYKCGDLLSKMHYLTWNPVGTDNPDYHRPEYFGVLEFE